MTTKPSGADFFNPDVSAAYDERNAHLKPVSDGMHFLMRLVLRGLPARARVLCVGVGTGAEILALAKAFPEWSFVGVDPSAPMLEAGRERLRNAGLLDRCELIHGYVHNAPSGENFDAALSVLVAHFIEPTERLRFFRAMVDRLRPGGTLVNAEISCDLESPAFPAMARDWEGLHGLTGATPDMLAKLPSQLREVLSVLPPTETENLLRQSGILLPVRFFQAFLICGWHGRKP